MMKLRVIGGPSVLFLGLLAGGCAMSTEPEPASPPQAQLDATAPPGAAVAAPHDGHAGRQHRKGHSPVRMLARAALRDASLEDAQRAAIEELLAELHPVEGRTSPAREALRDALAKGVADGRLDDDEVAPQREALVNERHAALEREADALNRLHAALRPDQRKALVAGLEESMRGTLRGAEPPGDRRRRGPRAEVDGRGKPHRRGWGHGRPDGEGPRGRAGGSKERHGAEARLVARLGLDGAQRERLREAMKSLHREKAKSPEQKDARRKAMSAAADAFVGEAFDARKSPMFALREERASKKVDARIGKLRAVLSVLRPDQVTRLTAIVAERRPGGDGHDEQRYESND